MTTTTKLHAMLTYKRPHGSPADNEFCERFIAPTGAEQDDAGNYILRIGDAPILWSAHTDTVHSKSGRQSIVHHEDGRITSTSGDCLGADDTVGVWIMLEMIRHDVPGLYIFHRGEEVGGIGSSWIASNTPEVVDGIDYAVAFDRRGTGSVITEQGGGRTCSRTFAQALADMIGLGMRPDPTGTYTDTVEYAGLIPECTNVSVGYDNAHRATEYLLEPFAQAMARVMCRVTAADIARLPVARDPAPVGWTSTKDDWWTDLNSADLADASADWADLYSIVLSHPEAATELLFQLGARERDILEAAQWVADADL